MTVEFKTVTLDVDEALKDKVQELEAAGWKPTCTPTMVYHLVREKPEEQEPGGALGIMRIDETKIHVFGPDGKPK